MKIGKEIWDDPVARDEYVDTMLWEQEIFRKKFYHLEYDELPDYIKLGMERHPRKHVMEVESPKVEVFYGKIQDEIIIWTDGEVYHIPTLGKITLHKWKIGQRVRITIELIQNSEQKSKEAED